MRSERKRILGEVSPILRNPDKLKLKEGMIKVSGDRIFYSLQGEGPTMGEPAVFVRTHLCNLQCSWCDTPYTWDKDMDEFWVEPEDFTIKEAAELIKDAWKPKDERIQKRVVLTGGEPLIQQNALIELIDELGDNWEVEIETNGTIMPDKRLMDRVRFNVSPKLDNSENLKRVRIKPNVIRRLSEGNTTFKFVVMHPEELDEIERDFIEGIGIPVIQVILMPQGVTAEEVKMNGQRVAEYAKEKGYRLLGRLQVDLWGTRRGV